MRQRGLVVTGTVIGVLPGAVTAKGPYVCDLGSSA